MSKAATSPTARLLQHSRLFSLPRPLPPASLESISSTGVYRASETATLPYPTHQAITTPASSHHRGDWGLKRPLPRRATASSTPHIRVSAQDNFQHITDFGSAADHTQTRAKWEEMGVPIMMPQFGREKKPPRSVYDTDDITTPNRQAGSNTHTGRWKYAGPSLAGMQPGEFNAFISNLLTRRNPSSGAKDITGSSHLPSFREHLRTRLHTRAIADARRTAQEAGETLHPSDLASLRPTDAELDAHIKQLRDEHVEQKLYSQLSASISEFLDLPSVLPSEAQAELDAYAQTSELKRAIFANLDNPSDDGSGDGNATPSTHPAVGLSYLRTNAVMENHPLHGPQAQRAPVLARVVRFRTSSMGTEYKAKLGVGGVVAEDPISNTYNPDRSPGPRGPGQEGKYDPHALVHAMDPAAETGSKIWVHPRQAWIDERGRIRLEVARAEGEAIAVKTGEVQAIHDERERIRNGYRRGGGAGAGMGIGGGGRMAPPGTAGNANFGFALPDLGALRAQQQQQQQRRAGWSAKNNAVARPLRVQGFDREGAARGQQQQQQRRGGDPVTQLTELLRSGRDQRQ
ncbi:hypothetical protein BAUCODRAFT_245493 [Baudoinia panamericana UAMH 10762]|uniref:Uncharacterized protein n=1 Tax=Baudoinia panamericana (strain UAMH 10762) TaxID=717646 RepID=M2N3I6_BAUPA|nr:uncharacterized protein BAUCODRAFT_245493 [Baudoinia panamericana UAMH 10762]EMC93559.1 hypothetical protein BAUCODRAFT_245493 [Baudoinia panamericana UAMH 10762]